ncbi:MAG: hypothetical protein ACYTG0_40125 [Planctomycetota bacterium]
MALFDTDCLGQHTFSLGLAHHPSGDHACGIDGLVPEVAARAVDGSYFFAIRAITSINGKRMIQGTSREAAYAGKSFQPLAVDYPAAVLLDLQFTDIRFRDGPVRTCRVKS